MAKIVPVTIPILGLNTVNPFVGFESGFARELTNYALIGGALRTRPAVQLASTAGLATPDIHWWDSDYGIARDGDIYDLTDGTTSSSIGGSCQAHATTCKHGSLDLVIGCQAPRSTIGPGFTAWSITTNVVTATAITSACSHKGRLYVAQGTTIEFSDIAQVTGAMPTGNSRNYASLLDNQNILRMFSVSVQPGNTSENVFVIFGQSGRVLVFTGEYPLSTSWTLIGKFDMSAPASNVSFVELDGDIWVSSKQYPYWFRELFSGGAQSAYTNSPGKPIENLWSSLTWGSTLSDPAASHSFALRIGGPWDLDCVLCQCSDASAVGLDEIADYQNVACFLVYFRKYQAWALWLTTPLYTPTREFGQGIVFGTDADNCKTAMLPFQGFDSYDNAGSSATIKIESTWKTPYTQRFEGNVQSLKGVRPYYKSTIDGKIHKVRAIFDYSDLNAPWGFYTQSNVTAIPPGSYVDGSLELPENTWDTYTGFAFIGGEGGTVSLQITHAPDEGTENDQQYRDIIAATMLIEDGGPMIGG